MKKIQPHPLASIFPMMIQEEIVELSKDIKEHKLRAPITLFEDMILDGRNRYEACLMAGVEPEFREHKGDALSFVISANLHRRHLSTSQRAMVAANLANMDRGGDHKSDQAANLPIEPSKDEKISISKAAEMLNVSPRSVRSAKKIRAEDPKAARQVEKGERTLASVMNGLDDEEEKKEPKQLLDKTGHPIPPAIVEGWNRAEEVKELMGSLSKIRCRVQEAIDNGELAYKELTNTAMADFNNAYTSLKQVVPYAVCTSCQGHHRKSCRLCSGRGFISEFRWKQCVPSELKAIRKKEVK